MKLEFVDLCGFRGYRNRTRVEFADGFTIIDGRNGAGKSTVFDAIEFALTGNIAKYGNRKSDGESVRDYLWWTAPGITPPTRYVEVGFTTSDGTAYTVRRTDTSGEDAEGLEAILPLLCDQAAMPADPLTQLCDVSIVRDERIAELSLDLKEADRYVRVRDAIGATDSADWISRGLRLVTQAKRRVETAQKEAEALAGRVETAQRRIDEIRASQQDAETVTAAASNLRTLTSSSAAPDELVAPAREYLARQATALAAFNKIARMWDEAELARAEKSKLEGELASIRSVVSGLLETAERLTARALADSSQALNKTAKDLATLIALGRQSGLIDGGCPLCSHKQDVRVFHAGIESVEAYVRQIDAQAIAQAAQETERARLTDELAVAVSKEQSVAGRLDQHFRTLDSFSRLMLEVGADDAPTRETIEGRTRELNERIAQAEQDLRVLETLKLSNTLERAVQEERQAKEAYAGAERRLGIARRGESRAQALHDAARRSAGETVDRRIERVLPLLSELYRRLRPHPTWDNIEYKIRGDVRRFMKLSVGDEQNPEFMFSSGQRRATGLAFLLSVNLSLAWSRWRSILLDDPVQHIDDFRSIQLTEVLSQVGSSGRQIICAVEDQSLADMMCRRLPIEGIGSGKRVTLGFGTDGALAVIRDEDLVPLPQSTFVQAPDTRAG